MTTGLSKKEIEILKKNLSYHNHIKQIIIYGSRALGNYKKGSDIDIALKGEDINLELIIRVKSELEATNLPYFFDIIHYDTITNQNLKKHIDNYGLDLNLL